MPILQRSEIIERLQNIKDRYAGEGFIIKGFFGSYSRDEADENSDIDILIEATPEFAGRYGFKAVSRIREIQSELSDFFKVPVDLADSTGMGRTAKKFIIDRAIYV